MEISKSGTRRAFKKALAVLSAAAMLIPAGIGTAFVGTEQTGIVAQAASDVATKLKVLDENGKDLGDNAVFYVDNSNANHDNVTSRKFKVVASNDNGAAVDDEIRIFAEGGADDHIQVSSPNASNEEMQVTVEGGYYDLSVDENGEYKNKDKDGNPAWVSKKPGTTHLYFTTAGGEVYRSVTIVVYEPATDMKVYSVTNKGKSEYKDSEGNTMKSVTIMTIANHKYQFDAEKVSNTSTDTVEWAVYEGNYSGTGTPKQTQKAEITQSGLFTPKTNGEVTIVAKYKATETSKREKSYGKRKIGKDTVEDYENVPKYIHVTIVKENPAIDITINNAPSAMEIGDTMKLSFESTPTYKGAGYESGATDVFTWTSSNPKVITVDEEGNIKAVGKGDAKITITAENENVNAEVYIKVLTKAQSISFSDKTISTRVGVDAVVTATMNPETADEEIVWTSSNPAVATVESLVTGAFTNSQTAVVRGVKVGSTIITARAKNSGVEAKITCNVTKKIDAADISLTTQSDSTITTIYAGSTISVFDQQSIKIDGALVAADGTSPDDTMVWEVIGNGENNGDYVTIESQTASSITLKGFASGTVTVKASSTNNPSISKSFKLQVLKRATKLVIINNGRDDQKFNKNLNVGSTLSLGGDLTIATNQPYEHNDRVAHWTSSNTSAVVVDDTGFVRVVGNGKATITAIAESGLKATTTLTGFTTSSVVVKGTGLVVKTDGSLPELPIALSKDMTATKTVSATVMNENDKAVTDVMLDWSSDNEAVATVDATGKITAHNIGEAVITVKSGNKTDSCIVYVQYPLGNATVTVDQATYIPGVTEYKPAVDVSYSYTETDILGQTTSYKVTLEEGKDYTLEYSNNTKVGLTGKVVVTGIGNYSSSVTKSFKISARPLSDPEVVIDNIEPQELTAENKSAGVKPEILIYHIGYKLVEGTDYTVAYTANKAVGSGIATITGKGNYSNKTTVSFEIYCNHEHKSLVKTITKATCQQAGEVQYKCDACGQTFNETVPMTGHDWKQVSVVEPTFEEGGYTLYRCSVCDEEEKRNFTPVLIKLVFTKCTLKVGTKTYASTATNMKCKPGEAVTLNCAASGGTAPYKYAFYYKLTSSSTWTKVGTEFGTARTVTFNAPKAGEYDIKVAIKDSAKQSAEKTMKLSVKEPVLNNTSVINSDIVQIGDKVRISASANGGDGKYTYAYYYKRSTNTKWITLGTEFGTTSSVAFAPTAEATYDVKVIVKDGEGLTAEKTFSVKSVKELELTNVSVVGRMSVKLGTAIPMIGKAVGGSGEPYTYAFYFKRTTNTNWKLLGDKFTETASARFKPTATGTYDIRIIVKDSTGATSTKLFVAECK